MTPKYHETMLKNLHPYLFVLKEGNAFHDNYLDYSLLMLQVTNTEIIRSPNGLSQAFPNPLFNKPIH
jgi:hypothetical protein